jgi:2'-5' RNA ligase
MIKLTDLLNEDRSKDSVDYGCLMAYVCAEDTAKMNKFGNKLIADKILYKEGDEFGRESECHCTIKYGFKPDLTREEVEELIKGLSVFELTLDSISEFKNGEKKGFDVVKFDVKSDLMKKLNKEASEFPNHDEHPDYHAHMTIAYVKPDTFGKEKKDLGIKVKVDKIVYSPIKGEKMTFKLSGNKQQDPAEKEVPDTADKEDDLNEAIDPQTVNREIQQLQLRWDRLDNMGGREIEKVAIANRLALLRHMKLQSPV